MKTCTQCRITKPFEDFHKDASRKLGVTAYCKECRLTKKKLEWANDPDKRARQAAYMKSRVDYYRKLKKIYNQNNRPSINAKKRERYLTDPDYKAKQAEDKKAYRKANRAAISAKKKEKYLTRPLTRAAVKANNAQYRKTKVSAQPRWLSEEDKQKIKDIYLLAEDVQVVTGERYQVDHIIPLRGKNVCGLHVPWNLQILPADINLAKGNKYEDEY